MHFDHFCARCLGEVESFDGIKSLDWISAITHINLLVTEVDIECGCISISSNSFVVEIINLCLIVTSLLSWVTGLNSEVQSSEVLVKLFTLQVNFLVLDALYVFLYKIILLSNPWKVKFFKFAQFFVIACFLFNDSIFFTLCREWFEFID